MKKLMMKLALGFGLACSMPAMADQPDWSCREGKGTIVCWDRNTGTQDRKKEFIVRVSIIDDGQGHTWFQQVSCKEWMWRSIEWDGQTWRLTGIPSTFPPFSMGDSLMQEFCNSNARKGTH